MPSGTFDRMFRPQDMQRLTDACDVVGPLMPDNGNAFTQALQAADILLTGWGSPSLDASLLAQAQRLRLVAHTAGSVRFLVNDAVFARGIRVVNSASENAVPVAQLTLAMIVSLLKQVPWISAAYAAGDYKEAKRRRAQCRELEDMEIGIIGASRVGRAVINLLKPYPNLTIRCYDPYLSPEAAKSLGVVLCSLEEACRCPVVSIHAPNIPETHHMFNARTLALLPDHAVLINTSRGALLDEAALVAEVRRRPLYVHLDVTDPEPPLADSPLRQEKNIILTPHIAGAMNQACRDMGRLAIDETLRFVRGDKLQYEVTQAMMPTQA